MNVKALSTRIAFPFARPSLATLTKGLTKQIAALDAHAEATRNKSLKVADQSLALAAKADDLAVEASKARRISKNLAGLIEG